MITGRNEAIIVELKELFVLNGTFTFSGGSPIIRFLTITKNGASSRLQFHNCCNKCLSRGKWNRHAVALSDNFYRHMPFF